MYLLDTNVVVHYLNKSLPQKSINFLNNFIDQECYISVISQMEALGFNFKNKSDKQVMEIFVENSIIPNYALEIYYKLKLLQK